MLHKTSRLCLTALTAALLTASTAFAQQDPNKALIDLLVKKGVLSQEDVNNLRAELAASPAPAAAAAPAPNSVVVVQSTGGAPGYSGASGAGVPVGGSSSSPLSFRIGIADFTPARPSLDFTGVYRTENTGGAIGSSFGSVPFSNGSTGQLSETKFSAQNSRVGLRIDSTAGGHEGHRIPRDGLPRQCGRQPLCHKQRRHASHAELRRRPEARAVRVPCRPGLEPSDAQSRWDLLVAIGHLLLEQHGHELPGGSHMGEAAPGSLFTFHATDELAFAVSVENPTSMSAAPSSCLRGILGWRGGHDGGL